MEAQRHENERAAWFREQIRQIEAHIASEQKRVAEYKRLLTLEVTGKVVPSAKSSGGRPIKVIKQILKAGPATRDEILAEMKNRAFNFKQLDEGLILDKSLIMCVKAGTLIQDGDVYSLPESKPKLVQPDPSGQGPSR